MKRGIEAQRVQVLDLVSGVARSAFLPDATASEFAMTTSV